MAIATAPRKFARFVIGLAAGLIIVGLVLWPGMSGGFIFDDYPNFADVAAMQVHSWSWDAWQGVWQHARSSVGRPLAMLSLALNYALGGGTWSFKATNLVIHLVNCLLLALLARRLLIWGWPPSQGESENDHERRVSVWAIVLATLWGLHPLQVSAVMYVVQRMELLGFTFTLIALLLYCRGRERQRRGERGWPWIVLAAATIPLGLTAKETVVLVPGYTLLLEWLILNFEGHTQRKRRVWQASYALGATLGLLIFLFYALPHFASEQSFAVRSFTPWERVLTQLRVLCMYIGWCLLPLPNQLHFYYDNYAASTGWLSPATTLVAGLGLLLLVVFAFAIRKKRPLMALGIGWFFMAHVLTSAPFSLELVFEHRNYPALFGILLAMADLTWWLTRQAHPRLPALIALVLLVGFGFQTLLRAATWGRPVQLAYTLAQENPHSARASYDLADLYLRTSKLDPASPYFSKAVAEFERGANLPTASALPEQALILLAARGKLPLQERWWTQLLEKMRDQPFGPQQISALTALLKASVTDGEDINPHHLQEACDIAVREMPWAEWLHVDYAEFAGVVLHDPDLASRHWHEAMVLNGPDPTYFKSILQHLVDDSRYIEAKAVASLGEQMAPDLKQDVAWQDLSRKMTRQP
ncbi:MAG: hypothetical protein ACTHMK_07350 [Dyella sp.]|uniref:hypothetical protein n=1 Tax=Dyella sp. TaxID=1869338 RepID=UPI003F7CE0DD